MSFIVKKKKTFSTNSQCINQHNQNSIETVTAISNKFVKQKSEIKHTHTHTIIVVIVKLYICLLDELCSSQHNKGHIEPANEPTCTVLGQA